MAELTRWQIDPSHTSVEFTVKHMMFTTVRGRFKDVKGRVEVDEQNPDRSSVYVEIAAASLDSGIADRDKHLHSADFFDVANHPTITFQSKRVEGALMKEGDKFFLVGDLRIRGTDIEVKLDCEFLGVGKDPWGAIRAGAEAHGKIDRRDWNLKWNQALEAGGVLVANEVRIEVQVQAVKAALEDRS
jgi:polyisoprenoid-binding protein YceI